MDDLILCILCGSGSADGDISKLTSWDTYINVHLATVFRAYGIC